jgi:hypothetical protein
MTPISDERLAANWRVVVDTIDQPAPSRLERVLRRCGLPGWTVRLAVSTPGLRRAWGAALATVVLFGLAAADPQRPRESLAGFLVLAPLVPLLGVASSYGAGADPAYELTVSTPRSGLRLVLLRTITVLVASFAVLAAASVLLPGRSALAFAWLLPSVAVTCGALALSTLLSPRRTVVAVGAAWLVVAAVVNGATNDRLSLFGPAAQVVCLVVALLATAVVAIRRDAYARLVA